MTTVYDVLIPQMGISIISWAQLVFSINRYVGPFSFSSNDMWALLLYLHGGVVRWVAALSVHTSSLFFQIVSACIAAALGWASFVIIFNEDFVLPTRQQTWALLMSIVVTILWEVNNRMVISL